MDSNTCGSTSCSANFRIISLSFPCVSVGSNAIPACRLRHVGIAHEILNLEPIAAHALSIFTLFFLDGSLDQ